MKRIAVALHDNFRKNDIIIISLFYVSQVAQHLTKLFDSMANLKFIMDSSKKPSKEAVGMYSKDGEYVNFSKSCHCVGQVSNHLQRAKITDQEDAA